MNAQVEIPRYLYLFKRGNIPLFIGECKNTTRNHLSKRNFTIRSIKENIPNEFSSFIKRERQNLSYGKRKQSEWIKKFESYSIEERRKKEEEFLKEQSQIKQNNIENQKNIVRNITNIDNNNNNNNKYEEIVDVLKKNHLDSVHNNKQNNIQKNEFFINEDINKNSYKIFNEADLPFTLYENKETMKTNNTKQYIKTKKEIQYVNKNEKERKEEDLESIDIQYNKIEEKKNITIYSDYIKKIFNNLFEKHLLFMNCLIAGTLYFIADITCQLMEIQKEQKEYDLFRTLRMSFIGITLEGPIMTWWYGKVLAKFIKSKPDTFLYKSFIPTLLDNFIFGPVHLTIFFFYNGILKKQNKEEIIDKITNTGVNVFLVSLLAWTPLTLINFFFVPRIYQATVIFFADFFWVNFLSWCANKT